MSDIPKQTKTKMEETINHLKEELKNIRTGRANPGMLDSVLVEVYGAQMRIRDIATVTTPESKQLLITPFDPHNANAIAKAIERANLNVMPMVDGHVVRIKIPPMDDSLRKEMAKLCGRRKEEAKISIRNIRRDSNELVKKGNLPEDLVKKLEKEIQELTDKYCKLADDLAHEKEKEVLTI
jgi:ribosome recycling factor